MKLLIYKSLWGMDEGTLQDKFKRIKEAGYDGVETGLPDKKGEKEFKKGLAKYKLDFIPMIFTEGPDHLVSYRRLVTAAARWEPRQITAHSGKDFLPYNQQLAYFREAVKIEKELGLTVAHETHRARFLYNAADTARLLKDVPELRINADFSHWCCVSGSLLQDQEPALRLASSRASHVHGRVGYEEGPQVPDPRAPEYARHLQQHEAWWSWIIAEHRKTGKKALTFTPEFGPPNYMHTLPYTQQPVADLWDICLWMAWRFRQKFKKEFS